MTHVGVNGNHSFLNVDDIYEGWSQILLEDHFFDLKDSRMENNQTQISTVGSMPISSMTEILMMSRNEVHLSRELVTPADKTESTKSKNLS